MFRSARLRGALRVNRPGVHKGTCEPNRLSRVYRRSIQRLFLRISPYTIFFIWMLAVSGGLQVLAVEAAQNDGRPHVKTKDTLGLLCLMPEQHVFIRDQGLESQYNGRNLVDKKACGGEKCRCCIDGFCSCMKKSQCDTSGGTCKTGKTKEDDTKSGWYRRVPFSPRSSALMSYAACTIGG